MSRNKKSGFSWVRLLTWLAVAGIVLALIVAGATAVLLADYLKNAPSVEDVEVKHALPSIVYDRNGEVITKFLIENRAVRKLSDMPQFLIDAVIAIEDHSFYTHKGINVTRIFGALLYDIANQTTEQGGSTITVQLARNVFLSHEKTLSRKIWEVFYAFQLERRYTKDEILEFYMNAIYFGHGCYGVEAASQLFFGKPIEKLTLAEAALLAGVPKGWLVYSPYRNLENAISRRNLILSEMAKMDYITSEQAEAAKKEEVKLAGLSKSAQSASYPAFMVRDYLLEKYGSEMLYEGGLTVKTTFDLKYQRIAESELVAKVPIAKTVKNGEISISYPQYAFTAIDPRTGEILALVGGRGEDEYNRALKATRSSGSTFKVFVYLEALKSGYTPASILEDKKIVYKIPGGKDYAPNNWNMLFDGPMRLREALAQSKNTIAVQLLDQMTPIKAIELARKMGITSLVTTGSVNDIGLALTLGGQTKGVIPLEMCAAYGILANRGIKVEPYFIQEIKGPDGRLLEKASPDKEVVLDENISYVMTNMLESVIGSPTGTAKIGYIGRPAAGKTGTGDNDTDVWFIGYTPEIVAACWIGEDTVKPLIYPVIGRVGSNYCVRVWAGFMKQVYADKPITKFKVPDGVITGFKICATSGLVPTTSCPAMKVINEVFIKGTEPKDPCNVHAPKPEVVLVRVCTESGKFAKDSCPDSSVAIYRYVKAADLYYEANDDGSPNYSKQVESTYCDIH